ncbi:unnamed protein product [Effrenium voratum]|uniref:Cwf19-like C-terminal domain-containing protein n=1 Tax=Effrenium voratum TaxID=2562239 RepID=A0AA36NIQ4_9DINO|nr:unnamed protein product [Effrenium voratum]
MRRHCRKEEGWFCLVNPKVEKHMIVTASTDVYIATARGPVNSYHVQVLPVKHAPCFAACPPDLQKALQVQMAALRKMFLDAGQECLIWERWIPMGLSAANHMQIQVLPIDQARADLSGGCAQANPRRAKWSGDLSAGFRNSDGTVVSRPGGEAMPWDRVLVNFVQCRPQSVRDSMRRVGWRECEQGEDWDVAWADTTAALYRAVLTLKPFQRVNHFPLMQMLCRKDLLAQHLRSMQQLCPSGAKEFSPSAGAALLLDVPEDALQQCVALAAISHCPKRSKVGFARSLGKSTPSARKSGVWKEDTPLVEESGCPRKAIPGLVSFLEDSTDSEMASEDCWTEEESTERCCGFRFLGRPVSKNYVQIMPAEGDAAGIWQEIQAGAARLAKGWTAARPQSQPPGEKAPGPKPRRASSRPVTTPRAKRSLTPACQNQRRDALPMRAAQVAY